MKKHTIRKDFLRLKIRSNSYRDCQGIIEKQYNIKCSIRTLKRWWKKFNTEDWDLLDLSQRPDKLQTKFSIEDRKLVGQYRKEHGYSANQLRIVLQEKGIFMSESTTKRIVKEAGLSRGNKMEGIRLKWVRFERDNPNSMWQLDGTETEDGYWVLPIEDDCSRYCLAIRKFKHMTTANVIALLEEAINMHGNPREILTDNGSEFGGTSKDSEFDKWCNKQGIKHIRSGVHKPQTVGKISAIQQTIMRELPYCNNDLEAWRKRYNHDRPHRSLHGLTPSKVYFEYKRHKKHYEL